MRIRIVMWMYMLPVLLTAIAPVHAQNFQVTCSVNSISDLAFGTVDPTSSLTNTTATISYACNNANHQFYSGVVCFSITDGLQNRQMQSGTNTLNFGVFSDTNHTVYWGINANALTVPVSIPNDSPNWTSTATLYGQVANGQTTAVQGPYTYPFAGGVTAIAVNVSKNPPAPTSCTGTGSTTGQSFNATATVQNKCIVSATNLDFGSPTGLLTSNVDAQSAITTQCVNGTPYQIALDNGQHASGSIRQMAGGASESIAYELYRDSGRSQRWGSTLGSDTVSATGNGSPQVTNVYGRVAPQPTPSPSSYSDTITVSVWY